jgi:hypothetical protein
MRHFGFELSFNGEWHREHGLGVLYKAPETMVADEHFVLMTLERAK